MKQNRISTNFFALAYGLGVVAPHLMNWLMTYGKSQDSIGKDTFASLCILAALIQVFTIVVLLIFVHKVWKPLQDGRASVSPAAASWLLLIPLFHLYWIFRAIWGFARDYNRFLKRRGLELRKAPERLYLACSILLAARWAYLTVGTLQPFFKGLTLLGPYSHILTICTLALTLIVIVKSAQAINALPGATAER